MVSTSSKQSIALTLNLFLERNNKAKVLDSAYDNIENSALREFDDNYENLGDRTYLLTIHYTDNDNLDEKIEELFTALEEQAEKRDCNIAHSYIHAANDKSRRWE